MSIASSSRGWSGGPAGASGASCAPSGGPAARPLLSTPAPSPSTAQAAADESADHAYAVLCGQLLALLRAARLVVHRHLEDLLAGLQQAGGDLRFDREARCPQRKPLEDVCANGLMAGHQVAQVDVEEDVRGQCDGAVAQDVE